MRVTPRPIKITPHINPYAEGSVLVEFGQTKVHITAIVKEEVPPFLKGKGKGWVSAEYSLLPGSTHTRHDRETKGLSGRTQEIQRLIARSLRAAIDLQLLGERSIMIDCDVLVADGGTRTTSISGGYVALALAIKSLMEKKLITKNPLRYQVAALSVGIAADGQILADLNYQEDSQCHTDMNVVMTECGKFVEVQGTAEGEPFSPEAMGQLMSCAQQSLRVVFKAQQEVLGL